MFEGLGLGSRLAYLELPPSMEWTRFAGAIAYGLTTPLGISIGMGIRYVSLCTGIVCLLTCSPAEQRTIQAQP